MLSGSIAEKIASAILDALQRANAAGQLKSSEQPRDIVQEPKDSRHGDVTSNVAFALAAVEGKPPRAIAEIIEAHLEPDENVSEVTVAGAGFINFRMAPKFWHSELRRAAAAGARFWYPPIGDGRKVQVEFLSANPTGPLTVGHGRNAVLGDTIARLYAATGFDVTREYYFNDGGRQMKLLGESVRARYLQELGRDASLPEDGYQGEYIRDIARNLIAEHGAALGDLSDRDVFRDAAVKQIFAEIGATWRRLGIEFDVYTNELDLMRAGRIEEVIEQLRAKDLLEDRDGAVWLKGTLLGLPKDQVLIRSGPDREPTYRTSDIAYHIEKLERGFDAVVDVFGSDHIAEHDGVIAALKALGHRTGSIRAIIYQFVTLTRRGERVKMSTRRATYVTLDELIDEVGADVVRFFLLFRKHDSHLEFDLDLAKRQAPENPVFYVQYAHARLASVFREAGRAGLELPLDSQAIDLKQLSGEELDLARKLIALPEVVRIAVENLEPHRLPFYLLELAGDFHRYYNKPANRIIGPDRGISLARLFMAGLTKSALACGLGLLGVSAPESM